MAQLTDDEREALRQQFPFSAQCRVEGGRLVVESRLINHSLAPAWVFNILWEYGPDGAVRRSASDGYVCLDADELRIGRMPYPYPVGQKIGASNVPHLSPLAAGSSLGERLTFAVPVDEYSCYQPRRADSPVEQVTASKVVVFYGLIAGGEEIAFRQDQATGGLHLVDGRLMDRSIVVRSEPALLKIAVNRRQDAFRRF